jgi:hypothetical protein
VEVAVESVDRALDALVPIRVDGDHDFLQKRRGRWNVEAPIIGDHVVEDHPWSGARAGADVVVDGDQGRVCGLGVTEAVDEVEAGS